MLITTESQSHREDEKAKDPRTNAIIAAAIEVHRALGPGLLESAYEECLCHDCGYKLDLVIEDEVVVELKSVEKVLPIHQAQLLTYLKLSGKHVGLLMNFNVSLLTQGITRRVM